MIHGCSPRRRAESESEAWRDEESDPRPSWCRSARGQLRYDLRSIEDVHEMLRQAGDWVPLGNADEQKPAKVGDSRSLGPDPRDPGWRGYAPQRRACGDGSPTMSRPCSRPSGLAEVSTHTRNNRVRAL